MNTWLIIAAVIGWALVQLPHLKGQPRREFEVASIKPNRTGSRAGGEHTAGGTLTTTNDSLKDLVKWAWGLKDFQLSGGPRWFDTDRFDIAAKSNGAGDLNENDLRVMLQALLADRFKLRVHSEKREVTAFSLVATNPTKLVEHTGKGESSLNRSNGRLVATKATIATLSGSLSQILGRQVADDTGLKGEYDYNIEWSTGEQPDSQLPSIFVALQEQLGLKLNATKRPTNILIIDSAERPSGN